MTEIIHWFIALLIVVVGVVGIWAWFAMLMSDGSSLQDAVGQTIVFFVMLYVAFMLVWGVKACTFDRSNSKSPNPVQVENSDCVHSNQ